MKDRFVKLAIQQASQSRMPNRLGAVLVRKKNVIGAGYNREDHPYLYGKGNRGKLRVPYLHPNMGLHAEVASLFGLEYEVTNDAIIYVVRLRKNDSIGMSKPCSSCHWYIASMGVKRVVYSDDNGNFHTMKVS